MRRTITETNIMIAQEFIRQFQFKDEDLIQEIYCLVLSLDEPIRSDPDSVCQAITDFTIEYLKKQREHSSHEELRPRIIQGVVCVPLSCRNMVRQCNDLDMVDILSELIIGHMI